MLAYINTNASVSNSIVRNIFVTSTNSESGGFIAYCGKILFFYFFFLFFFFLFFFLYIFIFFFFFFSGRATFFNCSLLVSNSSFMNTIISSSGAAGLVGQTTSKKLKI